MLRIISPCRDAKESAIIIEHVASVVDIEYEHTTCKGPLIFQNKNAGMNSCDYDYLQWDTDIRATGDQVRQIIGDGDKIVGGAYEHRNYDRFCAGVWTRVPLSDEEMLVPYGTSGIVSVPWVGAGFLFIPGSLLRRMDKPYFRHVFVGDTQTGEDVGFCLHAINNGYKIWLNADCLVEHII